MAYNFNSIKSDWRPEAVYPDLSGAPAIAYDVETYDPRLLEQGPGAIRKDGYICGFSVGTPDGWAKYYPIRHDNGDNLEEPANAVRWLADVLGTNIPKIGANLLYDVMWTKCDLGIETRGKLYDIQVAEPLLDENRASYSLDSLATDYLGSGKIEELLYRIGAHVLGLTASKKITEESTDKERAKDIIFQVKSRIWELPARFVGPYAEGDVILPLKIFELQKKKLIEQDLWKLFDEIETEILEILVKMQLRGIPVDIAKGERARDELRRRQEECLRKIQRRIGRDIDIWSAPDIAKACNELGLPYPLTEKENPSFQSEWLADQEHEFFKMLLAARQFDRSGSVFIEEKILNLAVNGRIHPQFHQVKGDRGGTVSGRFSSSNPNGQNFPSRNEELAKLVRGVLMAEPGAEWGCADWKQQEPKLTVHYAAMLNLRGAKEAQKRYIEDPYTDYHQMTADLTGLKRKMAKTVNLGLTYGMGAKKFGSKYGFSLMEAKGIYNTYHAGMPFIKGLTSACEGAVKHKGYIKTLLGRRCHFTAWGPPDWWGFLAKKKYGPNHDFDVWDEKIQSELKEFAKQKGYRPCGHEEALALFGPPIILFGTYKAANRLIQGSAADMMKKAIIDLYRVGYLPCLTVHDENDFCDITSAKQINEIRDIMENCVKLSVPLTLDFEVGPSWGELEEVF
jgi:DNA polymerase I-like protein with 3'-5' exonuclease and polymerase domains